MQNFENLDVFEILITKKCKNVEQPFCQIRAQIINYPSIEICVLGAQKNHLIETVLLSDHNICFEWEIKKIVFQYALLY